MAKQTINQGTAPTGVGGDTFRTGSAKLQANDDELYAAFGASGGVLPVALPIVKGGTGATTAANARNNLGLGTAATGTLTTSYQDSTVGRVLKVGDFGVGVANMAITQDMPSAIGSISPSSGEVMPVGVSVSIQGIHLKSINSFGSDLMTTRGGQSRLFSRNYDASGTAQPWVEYLSKVNTATDSNGFIKAASPIVELYADHIELNDEAKQQNIEFEKLGVGDYLIKGSSGFAQEGWYIETPKDANGNLLVAVVYEQLANGDISVKTYDYMLNNKGRIVADTETPLDIPENRWIDLRLQELPQPEIEGSESMAPPEFQPTGLAQAVATVMESYHDPEQ